MNGTDLSDAATARTRDTLLRIADGCSKDRHAFMARDAREVGHLDKLRLVVFSARGLGFPQQFDQLVVAAALRGGDVAAVVIDKEEQDNVEWLRARGVPVVSVDDFFADVSPYRDHVVVDRTCTWYPGVRYKVRLKQAGLRFLRVEQFLNAPGLEAAGGSYRDHADTMLARLPEYLAAERHFADAFSRQTYYYTLAAFISMNHEYFAFHCGDYKRRYFADDVGLAFDASTVYADCGSHDGQEVLIFDALAEGRYAAAHAFEPDRRNFIDLSDNVARHVAAGGNPRIYCHELGVYDRNAFLRADGYSAGVSIIDGTRDHGAPTSPVATTASEAGIHVCRLDDKLDRLDHLRLEVEGAELQALQGAAGLIARDRPSLTVSAYHQASDFLDLPAFIEATGKGYRMALRHQSLEPGVLCIYAV